MLDDCVRTVSIDDAARVIAERARSTACTASSRSTPERLWGPPAPGIEHDVWTLLRRALRGAGPGRVRRPDRLPLGLRRPHLRRRRRARVRRPDLLQPGAAHLLDDARGGRWRGSRPVRRVRGRGVPGRRSTEAGVHDRRLLAAALGRDSGEIHTVCIGRPFNIDYVAMARNGHPPPRVRQRLRRRRSTSSPATSSPGARPATSISSVRTSTSTRRCSRSGGRGPRCGPGSRSWVRGVLPLRRGLVVHREPVSVAPARGRGCDPEPPLDLRAGGPPGDHRRPAGLVPLRRTWPAWVSTSTWWMTTTARCGRPSSPRTRRGSGVATPSRLAAGSRSTPRSTRCSPCSNGPGRTTSPRRRSSAAGRSQIAPYRSTSPKHRSVDFVGS